MKRALITGGAGFFGGILKQVLLGSEVECVTIDLLPDPLKHPGLTSYQIDIRNHDAVNAVFQTHQFDAVFHCAAVLAHGKADPKFLWTSNVHGTEAVADACVSFGVPNFIYTSSNCLWGKALGRAVDEAAEPCPVEIYGKSKLESERVLSRYTDRLKICTVRCPTIIDSGRLGLLTILYDFIREDRRIWTVGGGGNRYQFIYAADLADACIRMVDYPASSTFNIGSDDVKPLRDVFMYVIKESGSRSRIASLPKAPSLAAMRLAYMLGLSPLGPYHYKMIAEDFVFDTTKIKRELKWRPTLTNEQMLFRGYCYYVENMAEILSRKDCSAHRQASAMGAIRLLKWVS